MKKDETSLRNKIKKLKATYNADIRARNIYLARNQPRRATIAQHAANVNLKKLIALENDLKDLEKNEH